MPNPPKTLVAYYGHHKCASSWFRRIFEDVGRWTGKRFEGFDNPEQFDSNLGQRVAQHHLEMVSYTNADHQQLRTLEPHKAVHIIRDPRDVLVSAYFSHLNSHSTEGWQALEPHRERLKSLELEAGLLAEIEFSECYLRQIYEWNYQQENVFETTFERVTRFPYESTLQIFEFLGLATERDFSLSSRISSLSKVVHLGVKRRLGVLWPIPWRSSSIPSHELFAIVYQQRYRKLAGGRKQGQEDPQSHYRKGKQGDWKNYFTERVHEAFEERYPQFLAKLPHTYDA